MSKREFLLQIFPELGGDTMAKQADHYRPAPKTIFVVATDRSYRVYTAEGHALNWFAKQADLNRNPVLIKYMPENEKEQE